MNTNKWEDSDGKNMHWESLKSPANYDLNRIYQIQKILYKNPERKW